MPDPISRRQAMTGVAIGGAIVWAAPSVVSVNAASAATVAPEPGPNLIINPSFELGGPGDSAIGWTFVPPA